MAVIISATTTSGNTIVNLGRRVMAVLIRSRNTNTDDVLFAFGGGRAGTNNTRIRGGEVLVFSVRDILQLKAALGEDISENDFLNLFAAQSVSGTQSLELTIQDMQNPRFIT